MFMYECSWLLAPCTILSSSSLFPFPFSMHEHKTDNDDDEEKEEVDEDEEEEVGTQPVIAAARWNERPGLVAVQSGLTKGRT